MEAAELKSNKSEQKMTSCSYLIYKESKSCTGCSGFRCTAGSREKKLSDVSACQNEEEWRECVKYLSLQPNAEATAATEATTAPEAPAPPTVCPYLGDIPLEGCCSATCYVKGVRVAIRKCRNWEACTRYLIAKLSGTPFRGGG
jgi:hypothetical protein